MSFQHANAKILVFAKAPEAGKVKTRLTTQYTPEQAAQIHRNLVHLTLATVCHSDLCPIELWCSPDTRHAFFQDCQARYNVTLKTQRGADLGERMHRAFEESLETSQQVIIIGTDCPTLTSTDLAQALSALAKSADCAIAPASDGGYVLIGLTKSNEMLFKDIDWGTDQVMRQTRERIAQQATRLATLNEHNDVDYPQDIAMLDTQLKARVLADVFPKTNAK